MSTEILPWGSCTTPRCKLFGIKRYTEVCPACSRPLRGVATVADEDMAIDLRLLKRALERAKGEVVRIETRIAELSKLNR